MSATTVKGKIRRRAPAGLAQTVRKLSAELDYTEQYIRIDMRLVEQGQAKARRLKMQLIELMNAHPRVLRWQRRKQ